MAGSRTTGTAQVRRLFNFFKVDIVALFGGVIASGTVRFMFLLVFAELVLLVHLVLEQPHLLAHMPAGSDNGYKKIEYEPYQHVKYYGPDNVFKHGHKVKPMMIYNLLRAAPEPFFKVFNE